MNPLRVVEIFRSIQGEGSQAGTPSVFVRLAGCNMWDGKDREAGRGECAAWCDTEFRDGIKLVPTQVADRVDDFLRRMAAPHVTITGGEPCLQLRSRSGEQLVRSLLSDGATVAVETNGTIPCRVLEWAGVHVTVSPKKLKARGSLDHVVVRSGQDLKVVVPGWSTGQLLEMKGWDFDNFCFQPKDEGDPLQHIQRAMTLASTFGGRVSMQLHKMIGVP